MFFIAGPCALESLEQVKPIVDLCLRWNIRYFRAQLYKPRTHPDSFQGLGERGLPIINYLLNHGLQLVAEAASFEQLNVVKDFASVIQIGARNMQNFEFLKKIGSTLITAQNPPFVLLKRGFSNTLEEWLASAQYLEHFGVSSSKIILCERGTRNSSAPTGVTLDLAMAYQAKLSAPYSVILDPSHGTRQTALVLPLARACLAMNLDGLMVEIHPDPLNSWSDAQQAVSLGDFEDFLQSVDLSFYSISMKQRMRGREKEESCDSVYNLI